MGLNPSTKLVKWKLKIKLYFDKNRYFVWGRKCLANFDTVAFYAISRIIGILIDRIPHHQRIALNGYENVKMLRSSAE